MKKMDMPWSISTGFRHFLWKRPGSLLRQADVVVGVESNFNGQFSKVPQMETGISIVHKVLRYDGRPLTVEYILKNEVLWRA